MSDPEISGKYSKLVLHTSKDSDNGKTNKRQASEEHIVLVETSDGPSESSSPSSAFSGWEQHSPNQIRFPTLQASNINKTLTSQKKIDQSPLGEEYTFSPQICLYSQSIQNSEPVFTRLYKRSAPHSHVHHTDELEASPPKKEGLDPAKKTLQLYNEAEGRRIKLEQTLEQVKLKEQNLREAKKMSLTSVQLLKKKFLKDIKYGLKQQGVQATGNNFKLTAGELQESLNIISFFLPQEVKQEDSTNNQAPIVLSQKEQKFQNMLCSFLDAHGTGVLEFSKLSRLTDLIFETPEGESADPIQKKLLRECRKRLNHYDFSAITFFRKKATLPPEEPPPTFKPELITKYGKDRMDVEQSTIQRHELLYLKVQDLKKKHELEEQKKIQDEMKHCTFSPQIRRYQGRHEGEDIDRHDLLYMKSKTQKQLPPSSLEKELKNCTFKPKINKTRYERDYFPPTVSPPKKNTPSPPGFEKIVARIRQANLEREIQEQQQNRTTFKRYTDSKPFSFSDSFSRRYGAVPLVYLDVAIAPDRVERLPVYGNSNPTVLARDFAALYNLDHNTVRILEEMIRETMQSLTSS